MSTTAATGLEPLSARVERGDGLVCVALVGEIDVATVDVLRDVLAQAVAEARSHPSSGLLDGERTSDQGLVVDLRAVRFMGAAGIGALVECHEALRSEGRSLRVRAAGDGLVRLFEITGMSHLLEADALSRVDGAAGRSAPH